MRMRKLMKFVMVCAATAPSPSMAAAAPDLVTNEAVLWLDAATLGAEAGTELDSWADARGAEYPAAATYTARKPQVIEIADGGLAGKKAVTFFSAGTECDMQFPSVMTLKTAFFVTDIDLSSNAYLLGGPVDGNSNYSFARGIGGGDGAVGSYRFGNLTCRYWHDGFAVADPKNTLMPTGYSLFTWTFSNGGRVKYIGRDRNVPGRVGGKRLCEVVAFSRELSAVERGLVEGYLKAKWWGGKSMAETVLDMIGRKAQARFDASDEANFAFGDAAEGAPAPVTQWNDLSGNARHLAPYHVDAANPRYGTRRELLYAPVYDMGGSGSGIDMKLPARLVDTRTVFMVADVDRNMYTYWLGDATNYDFARGESLKDNANGAYAHSTGGAKIQWNGVIYRNGARVNNPLYELPDPPGGGLSVYSFVVDANCCWEYLARDRSSGVQKSGGKRIAELMAFDYTLPDADREIVEGLLMDKWRPSGEYIDALVASAPLHLDASSAANFTLDGGGISGWRNSGAGADAFKPSRLYNNSTVLSCEYGAYGFTNGVPAFMMGAAGSNVDMAFDRLSGIRAVFWAMDIQRHADAFFLGDGKNERNASSAYHFCRNGAEYGTVGGYASAMYAHAAFRLGPIYCDGSCVVDATTECPPYGMHVYNVALESPLAASSLSQDRNCPGRNGGRAISELLVFTNLVSGLTADAIRERMERRWTRGCGWAGEGDAEWGAGKYRVFGGDAEVPAAGASAEGVGFAASGALGGGALALGAGGIFASEGAEVTVAAPLSGSIGAYGPGKVTLAQAPGTADSLSVGYGATLVMPPGGEIAGALSIQEKGRLVLDVSNLARGAHATVAFGAAPVLPAGGTVHDYVSTTASEGYMLTLSADGRTLHVNDPLVAVSAEWNGGAGGDAKNPSNWECRNFCGDVVQDVLPGVYTTDVKLNADCDLSGWGTPVFANGVAIDLNGHELKVADFDDAGYPGAAVSNSASSTTASLVVEVAAGRSARIASALIDGNVRLVKTGGGTLVAAKGSQTFVGGTEIRDGVLETGIDPRNFPHGARGSVITVLADGESNGVFDLGGFVAHGGAVGAGYAFVLDGGVIRNTGGNLDVTWGQLADVRLAADSEFQVARNWGIMQSATTLDLGGHSLKIAIGSDGRNFLLHNCEVKNGFVDVVSGGWFQSGLDHYDGNKPNVATNVDFRFNCALKIYAPLSVRNYEQVYGYNNNDGTGVFSVHGTFKPAAHDYFYGVTMMGGSTIDLSRRTSALPLTSSFTTGRNTIDFAANAKVTVDLSGHADVAALAKSGDYVVTWTEATAPGADVTFRLDAATAAKYTLKADATGLRLGRGGFMLIVR
ncbi:MAG: hypothetical protein II649_02485 [Kiritimatiellae bacterium]|nr:hypothetical protein [Kiritimatiellia bacterium]